MHTNTTIALKSNFMSSLLIVVLYFFKYAFFLIPYKIENPHIKDAKKMDLIFLLLNAVFVTV